MRILALDISTKCGWAAWNGSRLTASGQQKFEIGRGESKGMRLIRFRKWLREMIAEVRPEVIAYERPSFFRGGAATEVIVGFTSVMQEEAAGAPREIDISPISTSTLKKHATGGGRAGKPEMIAAAQKRWKIREEITDDEADALCVLAWAVTECGDDDSANRSPPMEDVFKACAAKKLPTIRIWGK